MGKNPSLTERVAAQRAMRGAGYAAGGARASGKIFIRGVAVAGVLGLALLVLCPMVASLNPQLTTHYLLFFGFGK